MKHHIKNAEHAISSLSPGSEYTASGVTDTGRQSNCTQCQGLKLEAYEKFRKALELCDRALEVNPCIGSVYLTRAACFVHLDDLPGAAKAYEDALAANRQLDQTHG